MATCHGAAQRDAVLPPTILPRRRVARLGASSAVRPQSAMIATSQTCPCPDGIIWLTRDRSMVGHKMHPLIVRFRDSVDGLTVGRTYGPSTDIRTIDGHTDHRRTYGSSTDIRTIDGHTDHRRTHRPSTDIRIIDGHTDHRLTYGSSTDTRTID